jgi:hypothetical protein
MANVINIPELFRAVTARVNNVLNTRNSDPFPVYFDYGRYLEVERRLAAKSVSSNSLKYKRFPLIWLVIPFREYNGDTEQYTKLRDLQIIICNLTDPNSTTPDRYATNFVTRLWPIYTEFLRQLPVTGYFSDITYNLQHTKTDQPYWDGGEGVSAGGANMFGDTIDAVQISNLELTVNNARCDNLRLIA